MATDTPELQTIPARHGVATFVPAGQTIKIINTSGGQVVDTWAFALPKPTPKKEQDAQQKQTQKEVKAADKQKKEEPQSAAGATANEVKAEQPKEEVAQKEETPAEKIEDQEEKPTPARRKSKKNGPDLPSQEEAEAATRDAITKAEQAESKAKAAGKTNGGPGQQKNTWSSYVPSVPSIGWSSKQNANQKPKEKSQKEKDEEQAKNSRTWASYFPSGKGFSSYMPSNASSTVSAFAATHTRDPSKTYLQQLQDFSKTPVGAAGLSALTGSGYGGSIYAGYQAWNAASGSDVPAMEFLSMTHTRAMTLHMVPKLNDTLLSNLREPMLTLVEDTSPGVHDTLIAACDPQRYKALGIDNWEQHGSCAENLVMALKELNERAGLKGNKAVGADVTINSVPAPLNLFMNIPWTNEGSLSYDAPKTKEGDYVRLKAERDVVVIMSACPQDILDINNRNPTDAHFIVEGEPATKKKPVPKRRTAAAQQSQRTSAQKEGVKKPVPLRRASSQPSTKVAEAAPSESTAGGSSTPQRPSTPKKTPVKRPSVQNQDSAASGAAAPPLPAPTTTTPAAKKAEPPTPAASGKQDSTPGDAETPKKKPRKLLLRKKAKQ